MCRHSGMTAGAVPPAALRLVGTSRQDASGASSADWALEAEPLMLWICPRLVGSLSALVGIVRTAVACVAVAEPTSLTSQGARRCLRVILKII